MKKMTAKDLRGLKRGDTVYKRRNSSLMKYEFVGLMPRNDDYLIFCAGEDLIHLYISSKDESFYGIYYSGEYSSEFAGNLIIKDLEDRIESTGNIYFKNDEYKAKLKLSKAAPELLEALQDVRTWYEENHHTLLKNEVTPICFSKALSVIIDVAE